eukprot:7173012-Lingulodinium_polyedra.AAC.1
MAGAQRAPPPPRPASDWTCQDAVRHRPDLTMQETLAAYAQARPLISKTELLINYLKELPAQRNMSPFVAAELVFLFFHGPECPLLYAIEFDT